MTKRKDDQKLRHELKHEINRADDVELTHRLSKLFRHDRFADTHGIYRVCSLYLDNFYDRALRQKIDGVDCREKFRIRYYGGDLSFIRLEKKIKKNGLCGKVSAKITQEQVQQLLQGKLRFLIESDEPLFHELYSKMYGQLLLPKVIVCYDREAFVYEPGNVRVTIDRNLRMGQNCMEFLNPRLPLMGIASGGSVLEVKYDEYLPELVRMAVNIPGRQTSAFSKYAICRQYD